MGKYLHWTIVSILLHLEEVTKLIGGVVNGNIVNIAVSCPPVTDPVEYNTETILLTNPQSAINIHEYFHLS